MLTLKLREMIALIGLLACITAGCDEVTCFAKPHDVKHEETPKEHTQRSEDVDIEDEFIEDEESPIEYELTEQNLCDLRCEKEAELCSQTHNECMMDCMHKGDATMLKWSKCQSCFEFVECTDLSEASCSNGSVKGEQYDDECVVSALQCAVCSEGGDPHSSSLAVCLDSCRSQKETAEAGDSCPADGADTDKCLSLCMGNELVLSDSCRMASETCNACLKTVEHYCAPKNQLLPYEDGACHQECAEYRECFSV